MKNHSAIGADDDEEKARRKAGRRREDAEVEIGLAEIAHFRREAGDRRAVGDEIGEAARDIERAERHDEGMRQFQDGEAEAVDGAAGDADERDRSG